MAGVGLQAKTCGLCQEAFQPLHNSSDERDSKYCVKCRDVFKSYAEENASTKIIKILEVLKRMIQEDGDEKALIFSQFTSFFDILRPFLRRANIKFVVCECLHIVNA